MIELHTVSLELNLNSQRNQRIDIIKGVSEELPEPAELLLWEAANVGNNPSGELFLSRGMVKIPHLGYLVPFTHNNK